MAAIEATQSQAYKFHSLGWGRAWGVDGLGLQSIRGAARWGLRNVAVGICNDSVIHQTG